MFDFQLTLVSANGAQPCRISAHRLRDDELCLLRLYLHSWLLVLLCPVYYAHTMIFMLAAMLICYSVAAAPKIPSGPENPTIVLHPLAVEQFIAAGGPVALLKVRLTSHQTCNYHDIYNNDNAKVDESQNA